MSHKNNSKKKIDKNLITLIKTFSKNKINYWVCHGTLLGIIRDNKLIPWDHDIDVAVIENKKIKKTISTILKKEGFKEIKKTILEDDGMLKFIKKGGRELDINFYKIDKNKKTVFVKWYVPKNFIMKLIDALSLAKSYSGKFNKVINLFGFAENQFSSLKNFFVQIGIFYSFAGYSHRIEYARKLKSHSFFGLKLVIPKNFIGYLEDLYGPKWKRPMRQYNWVKHSPSTITFK